MSIKGIDISSNNGALIDFHAVRKSGVRFVYIKVSEGTYVNPYARRHATEAKAAGLLVGAYCFVTPKDGRTGRWEADHFLQKAREAGLLDEGCLRPAADIEVTRLPAGKPSRRYHYDFVERLIRHMERRSEGEALFGAFDCRPMIYTGGWFWDGVLGARNAHGCPLWLAAYSRAWKTLIPKAFRQGVSIHQHTDKGTVPGITTSVDLNTYFGNDVNQLRRRHCLRRGI